MMKPSHILIAIGLVISFFAGAIIGYDAGFYEGYETGIDHGMAFAYGIYVFSEDEECGYINLVKAREYVKYLNENCMEVWISEEHIRFSVDNIIVDESCGSLCDNLEYTIYKVCSVGDTIYIELVENE